MRLAALASLSVLCGLPACAVLTATPPSVDIADVRLDGIGLPDQRLGVLLCVTNPNRTALDFSRVTTTLDIAGAPLADAVSDTPVHLPPLASVTVPFTVVATIRNLGPQLPGIVQSGQIDYRLHGTVSLVSPAFTLPYSRSGHLDPVLGGLRLAAANRTPSPCGAQVPG